VRAAPSPDSGSPSAASSRGEARAPVRWARSVRDLWRRGLAIARRLLADPLAPITVLCLILVVSLFARVYDLSQPCSKPCTTVASHTLIFDEAYYVNAAMNIAGITPASGQDYGGARCTSSNETHCSAPPGDDPNAEHPQLAKAIIALGIKIFGNNPKGWRLPSVLFGLIALVALYTLVRGAGGSPWLAVGATAVAATDNLFLVHGRIATLDIFGVAMMLISASFYVRRRPWLAGIALGIGGNMKETALYLAAAFAVYEGLRLLRALWIDRSARDWIRTGLRPVVECILTGAVVFMLVLWIMDMIVPAYDTGTMITYAGSPFTHLFHIIHYAALLKAVPYATGISSTPFEWLLDERTINYARVAVNSIANGQIVASKPVTFFQGAINPFIIFLAIPATFAAVAQWWRDNDRVALIGVAWVLGTYIPSVVNAEIMGRTAYLYYMVIIMPGVYVVVTKLFARPAMPRSAVVGWALCLIYSLFNLYPIQTLFK